jgi:hypothetical protein
MTSFIYFVIRNSSFAFEHVSPWGQVLFLTVVILWLCYNQPSIRGKVEINCGLRITK